MAGETVTLKDAYDFFVEANLGGNGFVRARSVRFEQEENCYQQQRKTGEKNSLRTAFHFELCIAKTPFLQKENLIWSRKYIRV